MLQATVVVLAAGAFVCFAWSVRGVFRPHGSHGGLVVIKVGAVASAMAELFALTRPGAVGGLRGLVGLLLFVASVILFWICVRTNARRPLTLAYSDDAPSHLVTEGPYRTVRHPFYLSYLTAYVAGLVASANPLLLVVVVGMGAVYHDAARREEGKFLRSWLSEAYARYREATPMFVPVPRWLVRSLRRPSATTGRVNTPG